MSAQPGLFPPYPHTSETARLAAERIRPTAASLRAQVMQLLESCPAGLTDEEIQERLSMPGNTERPRRSELVSMGWVADSGQRRPTRSGRKATVWKAVRR